MMHPACELCRGACCETLTVPVEIVGTDGDRRDFFRWVAYHNIFWNGDDIRLETRCSCLTPDGLCDVYGTGRRPQLCDDYPVGGDSCRTAVRDRRPDQAEQILQLVNRSENDDHEPA